MKIGLVGYQGGGKSTLFELLTGQKPDLAKTQTGQVGVSMVPDERFDKLVAHYKPKKIVPTKIDLLDTPGLSRTHPEDNASRFGVIRESHVLVQVIGTHGGVGAVAEVENFAGDIVLADLQIVTNRLSRLEKDVAKPRPDREELQREFAALRPIAAILEAGDSLAGATFTEDQEKACRSFSLLTRKPRLVVLNTADSSRDEAAIAKLEAQGLKVVSAPAGLELELAALAEDERAMFAEEMGLSESCRERLQRAIFEVTEQITFYTSGEKEVHGWLLKRGSTVLEAADSIHSDLARTFVRAEIWCVDDLLRLGSERDLKAAGLNHVEGKDYIVKDGDEVFIRAGA